MRRALFLSKGRRYLSGNFYKVGNDLPQVAPSIGNLADGNSYGNASKIRIIPQVLDNNMDPKKFRPGETIEVPYELTLSPSLRDFWQSSFYCHDRINTSTPFARSLGFQDQVMPFSLMLFLTASMTHVDQAKLITSYRNARYHWPAFAGDTVQKKFIIRSLRSTSDGLSSSILVECLLKNQRGVTLFSVDKTMLFPSVPPSDVEIPCSAQSHGDKFLNHIIHQADILRGKGSQTFTPLRTGQLILHTLTKPFSQSQCMQLSSLARLTHEKVFNTQLYSHNELYVPGALVLALTCSIASRDLHEILFEEMMECSFPNKLNPDDTVGALTFVDSLEEHVTGEIEALTIRTIGIKNMDVLRALANKEFPLELFKGNFPKPSSLKSILKTSERDADHAHSLPEGLASSIVCIVDRKIYRQCPKQAPFLL